MSSNTSGQVYRKIRALKKPPSKEIPYLNVRSRTFYGKDVKNGFYTSISELKKKDDDLTDKKAIHIDYIEDYRNILDVCKTKRDIPNISVEGSDKILLKMKANVNNIIQSHKC